MEQPENCGADSDRQHGATKLAPSAWHQLFHGFAANTDDGDFLAPVPLVISPEYHASGAIRLAFETCGGDDPTAVNCVERNGFPNGVPRPPP